MKLYAVSQLILHISKTIYTLSKLNDGKRTDSVMLPCSVVYEDGLTTIFLYTKGTEGAPSQELKDMLKCIENTTVENATNDNLRNLKHLVDRIKENGEVGVRYMKSWEYEELVRREGIEEGKKEGMKEGMKAGKKEGMKEGMKEGERKKALEIAKSLLDILDSETIAKKTGVSEQEVLHLMESN